MEYNCLFLKLSLITSGTAFKAIPCIAMFFFSLFLLGRIEEGKKSTISIKNNHEDNKAKIDRSSKFIQVVLVVFLVTESPQALFSIIGGLFLIDYINYYQSLAIFMNILAFFNTTTSFIIYSALSAKFRKLFAQILLPAAVTEKIYRKKSTVVVHSVVHSSRTL
ncbi:unnamed protein product [Caenorhabditis sp. 36 PRJEB53466]|nr:unnamed protein product [Caenorhabditis sp. 36 PRJEB53466]